MNLLLVTNDFPPRSGGIQQYCHNLVSRLPADRVVVYAPAWPGAEARADWVSLEVTRDPATAVAVERRLALENRADLRPNPLMLAMFASHPTTMARIAQARLWAERQQG